MKEYPNYIITPEKSYKSIAFDDPSEIYNDQYWSAHQNHSTIDEQVTNVIGKNELVKAEICYGNPKRILEIACAPAYLLGELEKDFECHGIEIDPTYKDEMQKYCPNSTLHFGFFPKVTNDWPDNFVCNIIALDVLEHVEDGLGFLKECHRLLANNGKLIIQSPIILQDKEMVDRMFFAREHIWIYYYLHLQKLMEEAWFEVTGFSRFQIGHEQVVGICKKNS